MTSPSRLLQVGIGKESAWGTGAAPAMTLPVTTAIASDTPTWIQSTGWAVAPAASFGHVIGSIAATVQLAGFVTLDTLGWLLAGILGDVSSTGASPNVWTMGLLNTGLQQPPSYALTVTDPTAARQYPGCRLSGVTLSFDGASLLSYTASAGGLVSVAPAGALPSPTAEPIVPAWTASLQLGGISEPRLMSLQLNLQRPVTPTFTVNQVLEPSNQRAGVLQVAGTMTVIAAADMYRAAMVAGSSTSMQITLTPAGLAANRGLTLRCSTVQMTKVDRDFGNRWVALTITFEADANTADAGPSGGLSPILATLTNGVPAGTYA